MSDRREPAELDAAVPSGVARLTRKLTPRERRQLRITTWTAGAAMGVFALLAIAGVLGWFAPFTGRGSAEPTPTPRAAELFVDPAAQVHEAAAADARFEQIAEVPQAKWFTGWSTPQTAERDVERYVDAASEQGQIPVLVLYQIPARDCGAFASGGLTRDDEYRAWIDAFARGLAGHPEAMVIVEPDAVAQLGRCEGQGDRSGLIAYAAGELSDTGASVYIDAGHSNWIEPDEMADRLVDAGIEWVRGFSVNVANFNTIADETAYADAVRQAIADKTGADPHYVIDTGRNGAGPQGAERCNPAGARLGTAPELFSGTALDGYLWVKNPGETDGACKGGPVSGFWEPAALSLLGLGGLE